MGKETIEICNHLWGDIPASIGDASKIVEKKKKKLYFNSNKLEALKKEIKKNQKRLGILTKETEEKIDSLHEGVVETGQQPNCLGGPSLVINKIICSEVISKKSKTVPLFSVVDYDGVRNELTTTRLPNLSKRGLLIQYPIIKNDLGKPIYSIKRPPEIWLSNALDKIRENYKPLIRNYKQKDIFNRNLSQIISILRFSYYSTENVSELFTKILGTILNLESATSIPFFWYSIPNIKKIFQESYEELLAEPVRTEFIKKTNMTTELIKINGYEPHRGKRKKNYVPFFIECRKCKTRLNPIYFKVPSESTASIVTKCIKCGENYEYSINPLKPDLSDMIDFLTPKVDTRQIIQNSVIPIVMRVGGSGENGYFAEIKPMANSMKKTWPSFFRYTRVFYNSPWVASKSKTLNENCFKTLESPILFNSLRKWINARNQDNLEEFIDAHKLMQYAIFSKYNALLKEEKKIQIKISEARKRLPYSDNPKTLLKEIQRYNKEAQELALYLSWAFGRNETEKFGQEVSWNWIDVAAQVGIEEMAPIYKRIYHDNTPNASIFYLNI